MIEKIYEDFTNKLLPELGKGLTITKGYFTELFGRYRNYLIVTDSSLILLGIILLVSAIVCSIKFKKITEDWGNYGDGKFFFTMGIALFYLAGILLLVFNVSNLMQDIFIPEIRIFEIIKNIK